MKTKRPKIEIRWIDDDDIATVARISRKCYGNHGMTVSDVRHFVEQTDHIPKVIRVDGKTVGYLLYVLEKGLVMIQDIAMLTSRVGHGTRVVKDLLSSLPRLRRRIVAVRVPETNLAAQLFFRSLGFKAFRIIDRKDGEAFYAMKYTAPE